MDERTVTVGQVVDRFEAPGTSATAAALALGIPVALYVGLCEWLDPTPVDSDRIGTRYAPNTRAVALQVSRTLAELRPVMGWDASL